MRFLPCSVHTQSSPVCAPSCRVPFNAAHTTRVKRGGEGNKRIAVDLLPASQQPKNIALVNVVQVSITGNMTRASSLKVGINRSMDLSSKYILSTDIFYLQIFKVQPPEEQNTCPRWSFGQITSMHNIQVRSPSHPPLQLLHKCTSCLQAQSFHAA